MKLKECKFLIKIRIEVKYIRMSRVYFKWIINNKCLQIKKRSKGIKA